MKKICFILVILLCLIGCGGNPPPPDASGIEAQEIGEGAVTFRFEVTDNAETTTVRAVSTDETTVGAALLAEGLIEGDVGEWGLFVTHVNGLRADFTEDNAWWAFYIDGEMAVTGVDDTDIKEGVTYAFIYTPA